MKKHTIHKITDYNEFKTLKDDWNRLASLQPEISLFLSFEWIDIFLRSYNKTCALNLFVINNEQNIICAILPILKEKKDILFFLKSNILLPTTNEHSHTINLISDGKDLNSYVKIILDTLNKEKIIISYLKDFPSNSLFTKKLLEHLQYSKDFKHGTIKTRSSVILNITKKNGKLQVPQSKKLAKHIRYMSNKLHRATTPEVKRYQNNDIYMAIEKIKEIAKNSWQTKNNTGLFCTPENTKFYNHLFALMAEKNYGSIWILSFDNQPIAYELHITTGSHTYVLKCEYDNNFHHFTPGLFLRLQVINRLTDEGIKTCNLSGYAEPYKLKWSKDTEEYSRIFIYRKSFIGQIAYFVMFPLRQSLKQTRVLKDFKLTKIPFASVVKKPTQNTAKA